MVEIPADDLPLLYADFMRQIKNRIVAMRGAFDRQTQTDDAGAGYVELEYCILQLRIIIELMALASLIAHNEIKDFRSKTFVKAWNAEVLLSELAKKSPSAFPLPVTISENPIDGAHDVIFHPLSAKTQDKIVSIYRRCGDVLHVGHLRSILKNKGRILYAEKIADDANIIIRILEQHVVILPGKRRMMMAFLRYAPTNDVHCFLTDIPPNGLIDPRSFPAPLE